MPIFEFHCPACDRDFEELVPSAGSTRTMACPGCGGRKVSRKISTFAAHSAPAQPKCQIPSASCDQCCGAGGECPF
ncbi:MAG: FmdB family zinc ribbon protein [Planctomycetota bacterium]